MPGHEREHGAFPKGLNEVRGRRIDGVRKIKVKSGFSNTVYEEKCYFTVHLSTRTRVRTHTHTCTRTRAHTRAHTHAHTHTHAHAHAHTCTRTRTHTHTHAHTHSLSPLKATDAAGRNKRVSGRRVPESLPAVLPCE